MTNELTIAEVDRYLALRNVIEAGVVSTFETGFALAEIRDSKLYRQDYKSFEDFCADTLDIAKRRAYQLIEGAEVIRSITHQPSLTMCTNVAHSKTGLVANGVPLPRNEGQARELLDVIPDRRGEVMKASADAAAESGKRLTAGVIRKTAKRLGAIRKKPTSANGKPKKPVVLCERCARVGVTPGCHKCKEARKTARDEARAIKDRDKQQATDIKDAFGTPIPKGRLDAWKDPWIQETFDALATFSEEFRGEMFGAGMEKRAKAYPFFEKQDFVNAVGWAIQYLDELIDHLKENRPAAVCPSCLGKGCGDCRSSGLVPRKVYMQLTGANQ